MAGKAKLSARAAATTKPGRYGDGRGLYLVVSDTGARKWVFRFTFAGRVTEVGLGSADSITLAQARDKAHKARKLVSESVNPIEARREAGKVLAGKPTFGQIADALLEAKASEWRNDKHRAQWKMTLETYAKPLRALPVDEVDTEAVLGVLQPIWRTTPETASRLRGRIETVLDAARAKDVIRRPQGPPPLVTRISRSSKAMTPVSLAKELLRHGSQKWFFATSEPSGD